MSFLKHSVISFTFAALLMACVGPTRRVARHAVPAPPAWPCAYVWPGHEHAPGENNVAPPCREPVPQAAIRRVIASTVAVWAQVTRPISPSITLTGWVKGTGSVIRDDGTIITANHLISGANAVKVYYQFLQPDGRTYAWREPVTMVVVKTAPAYDVALLRPLVPSADAIPAPLAVCRRSPHHGQMLWKVGKEVAWSVAYVGRAPMYFHVPEVNQDYRGFELRTLGRHGDSGGPIVDQQARLYGLYVAGDTKHHLVGLGIAVDEALTVLDVHAQFEETCE